jgi:hypothetical protein
VLETEDDVLGGLFRELKAGIADNSPRLAQWRDEGLRFRSAKSERQRGSNAAQHLDRARAGRDA